jgi:hypothetical protein
MPLLWYFTIIGNTINIIPIVFAKNINQIEMPGEK